MDALLALTTANDFAKQLKEGVAALRQPFSTCEASYLSNLLSARQACLFDLHRHREPDEEWSGLVAPVPDLAHGELARPEDHAEFVGAWDAIVEEVDGQIATFRAFATGAEKKTRKKKA